MTNRRLPDRFEHAQEAMYVVQRIRKRIAQGVSDTRLRGKMAYDIETLFRTERGNGGGVGQIEMLKLQPGSRSNRTRTAVLDPELAQAVQLQLDIVVAVEAVDAEDAVA